MMDPERRKQSAREALRWRRGLALVLVALVFGCAEQDELEVLGFPQPPARGVVDAWLPLVESGAPLAETRVGGEIVVGRTPSGRETLRIKNVPAETPSTGRPGVFLAIEGDLEALMNDGPVTVHVAARSTTAVRGHTFAVAYSTNSAGNSGWREFELSDRFQHFQFEFTVREQTTFSGDYVGLLPDVSGGGAEIEVLAVALDKAGVVIEPPPELASPGASAAITSGPVNRVLTAFHDVEVVHLRLPRVHSKRGGIAQLGDGIVYAAQKGRVFFLPSLDPDGASAAYEVAVVPFDHENPVLDKFIEAHVSVLGVAVRRPSEGVASGAYGFYVSHIGVDPPGRCVFVELSTTGLRMDENGTLRQDGGWTSLYRSSPCIPIDDLRPGSLLQGGGRLALDGGRLFLTVGDFAMDVGGGPAVGQLPEYGNGKLVRIDLESGEVVFHTTGHRNAQGLGFDGEGRLWSTEHGPEGGDEINLIQEGLNYGFPEVTLGSTYGGLTWPRSARPNHHDGFEPPRFAFLPSPGISQIRRLESGREFPAWQGDFFVGSLKARTLYRVHEEKGRLVYAEPILLGARLRDVIEFSDGRPVILTDGHELLVLQNVDGAPSSADGIEPAAPFSGEALDEAIASALAVGDRDRGRSTFEGGCAECHSLEPGAVVVGPSLGCVLGRAIGSAPGFRYSEALREMRGSRWDAVSLVAFLSGPSGFAPGTTMAGVVFDTPAQVNDLVAFLGSTRGSASCPE
ncbi:MAG: PQQ-dependent sugar dehydrogenase [bacterium]|nr:PQQ-dependent sugar dehydrogenase [bacterium]